MDKQIAQIFGSVSRPPGISRWGGFQEGGPTAFVTAILRTAIIGAGLFALINFILAGYSFLSAGGDANKIAAAWAKIWQSVLGLAIAVGSFVLAAIVGQLLFGDYYRLLRISIYGPN
jgi:hypothetical protein